MHTRCDNAATSIFPPLLFAFTVHRFAIEAEKRGTKDRVFHQGKYFENYVSKFVVGRSDNKLIRLCVFYARELVIPR